MNNATLQAPQAFSGIAIDPTTAWTLLVVVAVLSTLVGVVFIVAIVWTCMVCSGRTDVLSQNCNRRAEYGRRNVDRFPPTHRECVEMGHLPSTNSMLRHHHPAASQDSGVSRGLGLRLSCHPDQVPNVPAPRSWTPSPPYELTNYHRRSQLGMKSKSQVQMQQVLEDEDEDAHFRHSLPAQQMISSCPRCSVGEKPSGLGGYSKSHYCNARSPFNPRQNSPVSDWSRGSIMRSPFEQAGGIDNPVFEHSPGYPVPPSVQHHHHHRHGQNDVMDKVEITVHSPQNASVRISPQQQQQDQRKQQQEEASKMQLGPLLEVPRKPMQRHRSRMFLHAPENAGPSNARNFIDDKKVDMDDTMDILLRNENQGPVACSSRQNTPQKKSQNEQYVVNVLSDFSASRSDPMVFQRKHYNTPNSSLVESLKDPAEIQLPSQSPEKNVEVFTDSVSRHQKNKSIRTTPYDPKKGAAYRNRNLTRFKSQQIVRTPYAYQRALSEIKLPPSSEVELCVGDQKAQFSVQKSHTPWSSEFGLCMSCGTHGTLQTNLFCAKERATQTAWDSNSTIDTTQDMDPTPSMSWDHLTPDPSPVLGAQDQDQSTEDEEQSSKILDDTTRIVGDSPKVFDDAPNNFCCSPQCRVNTSRGTVNSSYSRNISCQTDLDSSPVPQTSFPSNSTQIQPCISELRDMSSAVSPMIRGSPFIFVDSRIRVDSPQFVVDSTQLRVESPYHITDTPISPFSETKTFGTTSLALRLAHSPLGNSFPLYSPELSNKSLISTDCSNREIGSFTGQNSGSFQHQSPTQFLLDDPGHSQKTETNKQTSQKQPRHRKDFHPESKVPQRLFPIATPYLQITSPNEVFQGLHNAAKHNILSPEKKLSTSQISEKGSSSCTTKVKQRHHGESITPKVVMDDISERRNSNELHLNSKLPQRLSPTATHFLQITSSKEVSQSLNGATKINTLSPEKKHSSSQISDNNGRSRCNTAQSEGESSPEVILADTLETLVTDDDN